MPKCALISIYKSFDIAPNILYTILFIVNCNECSSAEFIGQTHVPYKRIGKHFDLINSNNTSSDALRPICSLCLLHKRIFCNNVPVSAEEPFALRDRLIKQKQMPVCKQFQVTTGPKTVTRQRRDCDLNLGPSAPEASTQNQSATEPPSGPVTCQNLTKYSTELD